MIYLGNMNDAMDHLLDLDGQTIEVGEGYWVKFEVKATTKTDFVPHGIRYSLTLHRPDKTRILGYDNAHAVKPQSNNPYKYAGQVFAYDHKHPYQGKPCPYQFDSPEKLIADFWDAVDKALDEEIKNGRS